MRAAQCQALPLLHPLWQACLNIFRPKKTKMQNEQLCPNCNEAVENGAIYCGNCGHKLTSESSVLEKGYQNATQPSASPLPNIRSPLPAASNQDIPSYAIPYSHHKQHY